MGRLDDRTAIITGAGGGIGLAYAQRFLAEGAKVVIAEIDEDTGSRAAATLAESHPDRVTFVATDITDEDSVVACSAAAADRFGAVDVLVNNAALYADFDTFDNDVDYLRKVLDINLVGQWLTCKAAVPHMIEAGGGRIINIASTAGYMWELPAMMPATEGLGSWSYAQSKWGVIGMTRLLAGQLGQHEITVNCIAPGLTTTAATDKQVPTDFQPMFAEWNATKRLAEPEDMTGVALFFASDDARMVNGQIMVVDGGGVMPT